jgi:hypothetical protein
MQIRERAGRTPDQILRSVIGYCQWRAGECWRNVSTSRFRYDQERWDYTDRKLPSRLSIHKLARMLAAQPGRSCLAGSPMDGRGDSGLRVSCRPDRLIDLIEYIHRINRVFGRCISCQRVFAEHEVWCPVGQAIDDVQTGLLKVNLRQREASAYLQLLFELTQIIEEIAGKLGNAELRAMVQKAAAHQKEFAEEMGLEIGDPL